MKKAILNWSGGKDATLALYKVQQAKSYQIESLFTTVSAELRRITMHGVRESLLLQQAQALGLPLQTLALPESTSMEVYNALMREAMEGFVQRGVVASIFGDIHLADLRAYREQQLQQMDLEGVFPIWQQPVAQTIREFIALGFKAVVVCVNARYLSKDFVGRKLDANFVGDLPAGVDVCGENGEFHSFVYDGPNFEQAVRFELGEIVYKNYKSDSEEVVPYDTGFYFQELLPL
jgi:uncharacterized protein (TIGR00290 family)